MAVVLFTCQVKHAYVNLNRLHVHHSTTPSTLTTRTCMQLTAACYLHGHEQLAVPQTPQQSQAKATQPNQPSMHADNTTGRQLLSPPSASRRARRLTSRTAETLPASYASRCVYEIKYADESSISILVLIASPKNQDL